jgi:hypothetical protein
MVIDIAPPSPGDEGLDGQPLGTEQATWGSIKALYR